MMAIGLALAALGFLIVIASEDRYPASTTQMVGAFAFIFGALGVVAGLVVFLWKHAP